MKIYCIIPVYNTEKYLKKCIESVLEQTYQDFIIYLVNDCSTDNSSVICQNFAKRFPDKIIYINKDINEGVDKTRFCALRKILDNRYLTADRGGVIFLDSDDYLSSDTFRRLNEAMIRNDADVVEMRANRVFGPIKRRIFSPVPSQVITQPFLFDKYYISFFGVNLLTPGVWGRLYKISLLKSANLQPSGFKMGEDLMFIMKLFPYIKKLALIDYKGYNYRIGGLTSRYNPTFWDDLKAQYFIKRAELIKHNYAKGFLPLAYELINIFYTSIGQRILCLNESKEKCCQWIENELSDSQLWDNLDVFNDSYVALFRNKDAQSIYEEGIRRLKAGRKRRVLKKILSIFIK